MARLLPIWGWLRHIQIPPVMGERGTERVVCVKVGWGCAAVEVGGLQAKIHPLLHPSNHASGAVLRSICPEQGTTCASDSPGQWHVQCPLKEYHEYFITNFSLLALFLETSSWVGSHFLLKLNPLKLAFGFPNPGPDLIHNEHKTIRYYEKAETSGHWKQFFKRTSPLSLTCGSWTTAGPEH